MITRILRNRLLVALDEALDMRSAEMHSALKFYGVLVRFATVLLRTFMWVLHHLPWFTRLLELCINSNVEPCR